MPVKKTLAGIGGALLLIGGGVEVTDQQINPYTPIGSTLQITASSTLPQAGDETVIVDKIQPKITLEKFNGEVAMGITYQGLQSQGDRPMLSQKVTWTQDPSQSMEVVPLEASTTMEDGGMEINIILNSEPASNVFNFVINGADNLDFFYQLPLWQEAGLAAPSKTCSDIQCGTATSSLIQRAANVVGSYAVYYRNHANHLEGGTNYGTGKAFQIFRPQIIDAKGNSVWGDLSYQNGLLTITVPQDFLDTAVYPVTVDPTVGYTTIGGSSLIATANKGYGLIFGATTANTGDTITSFSVYSRTTGTGTFTVWLSAFSISGSLPVNKVAAEQIVQKTCGTADGFMTTVTVSQALSGGTAYDPAFVTSNSCSVADTIAFDTTSGTQSSIGNAPLSVMSTPWVSNSTSAQQYSEFFTYTAGIPTSLPVSTQIKGQAIINSKVIIK